MIKDIYLDAAEKSNILNSFRIYDNPKRNNFQSKNNSKPWFDKNCANLRSEYFRLKNISKRDKSDSVLNELKKTRKNYKKAIYLAQNKFDANVHNELRSLKKSQPQAYWNIINSANGMKDNNVPIDIETLQEHFRNLSQTTNDNAETSNPDYASTPTSNECLNREISIEEVLKQINRLKNGKAHGEDLILNEFLKYSTNSLMNTIVKLFNIVLENGIVPTEWTVGLIRPLYKKKGNPTDPNNYRGITLLSCFGKLFTAVLNERLTSYFEENHLIGEEQAGFRHGHSTLDHIFVLHSLIDLYLSKRERVYCAFIDYKKAFDLVDRSSLWGKLLKNNVDGNFFRVINHMYKQAKSCVISDSKKSDVFDCNIGVRQGENLSPILFALFLNDFNEFICEKFQGIDILPRKIDSALDENGFDVYFKLFTLLYADDTIVLAQSESELQLALDALSQYCKKWFLHVNTSKTKVVVFSRGKIRKIPIFKFQNDIVEVVDEYVYLGTTFNYNNKFRKAQVKQINQARRAMYSLLSKTYQLHLPMDILIELFDQLVLPILLYGSEVWGFETIKDLELLHMKFCKQILNVRKNTANCMVLGELGRLKLEKYIESRMINFWCNLVHSGQDKLSGKVYSIMKILFEENIYQSPWIKKIKMTLDNIGMNNLWDSCETTSREWVKNSVERRLLDVHMQNLSSAIFENSQSTTYRIFKQNLRFEKYLTDLPKKERITLCRFRCANHHLPIVAGRYSNTPRNMRFCNLCNLQSLGDEFHYLFECPFFANDRNLFIKKYFSRRPNTYKMDQLFNSTNTKTILNLAKFCRKITKHFK